MPHSQSKAKKSAAGFGSIRKKTVTRGEKEYTYWEARYTAGIDPNTGKQIQRSISGKTQKEVAQKLKAVTAAIDAGTYTEPCKMTVGEWLDIWTHDYLLNLKPLTLSIYSGYVKNYLKPTLGVIPLGKLDTHSIQLFYKSLSTEEGKNLSAKTVKNIHGVLHKSLQQAVTNGYIRKNPATACVLPKVQKPELTPLETDEIALFLHEAEKDSYQNLFTVAIFTGMRQGELLGLSWEYVDFKSGCIRIKQQLQCKDGTYFLCSPKNGKSRTITPAPVVMDALLQEKKKQDAARLYAGSAWNNPYNLVFTDNKGKQLVRRTVVKHFKAIVQRAGVSDIRFHDLRHSFAVASLQAGDDIKTLQSNLGHATAAFTLDVYGHVSEKMRRDSAIRMQHFYESIIQHET